MIIQGTYLSLMYYYFYFNNVCNKNLLLSLITQSLSMCIYVINIVVILYSKIFHNILIKIKHNSSKNYTHRSIWKIKQIISNNKL